MPNTLHKMKLNDRFFSLIGFVLALSSSIFLLLFVDRTSHLLLVSLNVLGWIGTITLFRFAKEKDVLFFLMLGIAIKLLGITSTPRLSDDVYRFMWDGNEISKSENPYKSLPSEVMASQTQSAFQAKIYNKLNSPNYYTVYPPLNQLMFELVHKLSPKNIESQLVGFRIYFILFELLLIFCLWKILPNKKVLLLLLLSPFWTIELFGNFHFELIEISFLLCSLLFIHKEKWLSSAVFFGLATSVKFHLLLVVPFILLLVPHRKKLVFFLISAGVFGSWFFAFLPFHHYQNMLESVQLFIKTFEFNASVFYAIRWVGFTAIGYDIIQKAGPILSLIAMVLITVFWWKANSTKQNIWAYALFGYTAYLFLAPVVHPWYITPLLILGVLSNYYYPFIWAFISILSYTAYFPDKVDESALGNAVEYFLVYGALIFEVWLKQKGNHFLEKSNLRSLYQS